MQHTFCQFNLTCSSHCRPYKGTLSAPLTTINGKFTCWSSYCTFTMTFPLNPLSGSHTSSELYPPVVGQKAPMFPIQTLWQQRHICCSVQLHIKRGAYYAHRYSNVTALQCIHWRILYTMKWSCDFSVTERTLDLPLQTFDFAICPVFPHRKHLSNLPLAHAYRHNANIVVLVLAYSVSRWPV